MPDWCRNSLTIEGSKELIADVKRILNRPFVASTYLWNATTGKMEFSETIYSNPVFAFHNIYNHIEDGVSDEEYLKPADFARATADIESFRGNNWYDWNMRNWGCKWDVGVADGEEEYADSINETELIDESETFLVYRFNTPIQDYGPWGPPIEAINKLSTLYPTLNFSLSYKDEETGSGGQVTLLNGFITVIEYYDNKCGGCESLNTMEYCDNDCGKICSECNYLGEAELDIVAECDIHKIYLDD